MFWAGGAQAQPAGNATPGALAASTPMQTADTVLAPTGGTGMAFPPAVLPSSMPEEAGGCATYYDSWGEGVYGLIM